MYYHHMQSMDDGLCMFASEVMPDGPANNTGMLIYNFAKFTLKLGCFGKHYYFSR